MAKRFCIKVNDLQPYYKVKVVDSDGNPVPLPGASIVCTMLARGGSSPKIDRQSTGINVTDEDGGEFEYQWQNGDTDTVGLYDIEFEITPQSGGKFTIPVKDEAKVAIVASRDSQ